MLPFMVIPVLKATHLVSQVVIIKEKIEYVAFGGGLEGSDTRYPNNYRRGPHHMAQKM